MPSLFDLLVGVVPGLIWLAYVRRKDRTDRETALGLLRVFCLGAAGAFLVGAFRPQFESLMLVGHAHTSGLVDSFIVTGLGEEAVKIGALLIGARWSRAWREPLDGVIYGAAAALGFASIENAYFLAQSSDTTLILYRAFTATLAHVAFTGIAGFFFSLAKFGRGDWAQLSSLSGVALAVLLHGVYDLFLNVSPRWSVVSLMVCLPASLAMLAVVSSQARKRAPCIVQSLVT